MKVNWCRKAATIIVLLILIHSFIGITAATESASEEHLSLQLVDPCAIEMPEQLAWATIQNGQCNALEQARDDAAAERDRSWDERSAVQQAQSDRQSELQAQCPEDLSIIGCTSDAVNTARLEYEAELEEANEAYDAAFERWSELNAAWWDCWRADHAGERYTPPSGLLDENTLIPDPGESGDGEALAVDDGGSEEAPDLGNDDENEETTSGDSNDGGGEDASTTGVTPTEIAAGAATATITGIVVFNAAQAARRKQTQNKDNQAETSAATASDITNKARGATNTAKDTVDLTQAVADKRSLSKTGKYQGTYNRVPSLFPSPPNGNPHLRITSGGVSKAAHRVKKVFGPLGRALDATEIAVAMAEEGRAGPKTQITAGRVIGGIAGASAGAAAGATIGIPAGPVGVLIGGVAGGIIGGMGGDNIGEGVMRAVINVFQK